MPLSEGLGVMGTRGVLRVSQADLLTASIAYTAYWMRSHWPAETIAIISALSIIPIIQLALSRTSLFTYGGEVRAYLSSLVGLSSAILLASASISEGLGNPLPILIALPFYVLMLSMGLGVWSGDAPGLTIMLTPVSMYMRPSIVSTAALSALMYLLALLQFARTRGSYGGSVAIRWQMPILSAIMLLSLPLPRTGLDFFGLVEAAALMLALALTMHVVGFKWAITTCAVATALAYTLGSYGLAYAALYSAFSMATSMPGFTRPGDKAKGVRLNRPS